MVRLGSKKDSTRGLLGDKNPHTESSHTRLSTLTTLGVLWVWLSGDLSVYGFLG